MRLIGHALLMLLALCMVVAGIVGGLRLWDAGRRLQPESARTLGDRVVFEAVTGQAMRFNVSNHQGWAELRGFVVAGVAARARVLPLTIEIEVLDAEARRLQIDRRYLELLATDPAPTPYGRLAGAAAPVWLLPEEWIDLASQPQAREIRVRLVDADAAIADVFWRASIETRLSDDAVRLRYNRLGARRRDALTVDWVTPASLIAPQTKRELLRRRQQPVGPLGQEGTDYRSRRVLRGQVERQRRHYARTDLREFAIGPTMRVGLPVPAPTRVRIRATAAAGEAPELTLWQAGPDGVRRIATIGQAPFEALLPVGDYELRAASEGAVDVRDIASGQRLAPDGLQTQGFPVGATRVLSYRLFEGDGRVAPLRADFRARSGPAKVRVQVLDAQGQPMFERQLRLPWRPSLYDRAFDALDRPLGEAVRLTIQPSAAARMLRIDAEGEVLSTVFTQVLARARSVDGPTPRRRWFSFLPEGAPARGVTVLQQPRLPGAIARRQPSARGQVRGAANLPTPRLRLRPDNGSDEREEEDSDASD